MTAAHRGWTHSVLLILVLLAAGFMRFHGLSSRGLVTWDDGHYMMEAKFIRSVYDHLPQVLQKLRAGDKEWFLREIEGFPPHSAKPGHAALIFLASLFVGMRDSTGALMSALLGTLTVLLVYQAGLRWLDRKAGLVAASVLSVSGLHLLYSRSPLAEADAAFFFLLGIYLLVEGVMAAKRARLLAMGGGLSLGYALSSNYRWFFVAAVLWLVLVTASLLQAERHLRPSRLRHFVLFGVVSLIPPFLFQAPYLLGRLWGMLPDLPLMQGYWESLLWFYTAKAGQGRFGPHGLFFKSLFLLEGGLALFLAAAGTFFALARFKDFRCLALIVPAAVPLAVFSLTTRGDRLVAISLVAPFLALLAGWGAHGLGSLLPRRLQGVFLGSLTAVILAIGGWNSSWVLQTKSGWAEAAEFARLNGDGKLLALQAGIAKFYLGREEVKIPPKSREKLAELSGKGYRYLAVDWKKHHADNYSSLLRDIETKCKPVREVPHKVRFFPIFVDDFHFPHPGSHLGQPVDLYQRILSDPKSEQIEIYDLNAYLGGNCQPAGAGVSPQVR